MLDFKRCNFYQDAEQKEYCPYSCTCKTECYFTLKSDTSETIDSMQEQLKDLKQQVKSLEQELDAYTDSSCEDRKHIECLYDTIAKILKKQKGAKTYEGLENKYGEILSYLEDYCNNVTRYVINKVL